MSSPTPAPHDFSEDTLKSTKRPVSKNALLFAAACAAGTASYLMLPESMDEPQRRMATIFVTALVLWVTEAVPLFATSMLVIVAQVWWLAVPEDIGVDIAYEEFFNALSNPIIYLFLGGFILAKALQLEGIDVQMAAVLLRPFGKKPWTILAGIMIITALLSMWMSNTAATTLMIALMIPMLARIETDDPFRKALILGVPLAANVGGIGTPIGTPPNAIALGELANRGLEIDFLQWMLFAVPLLIGALILMWGLLVVLFPCRRKELDVQVAAEFRLSFKRIVVYATFWLTVGLWMTSPLHNIPNAVIAAIPAAILPIARVVDRKDFNSLEWDVLVLIAGGIALATGMRLTGLDGWLLAGLPLESMPFWLLAATGVTVTMLLSAVMSNTVAANIVMPLAMTAAAVFSASEDVRVIGVMVAMGASFAMALPISTPPNAIAYGTGMLPSRDMMLVGGLVSVLCTILIAATGPVVIHFALALLE